MLAMARTILAVALLIPLAGCTVMDGNAASQLVDRDTITGSIARPDPVDARELSDGRMIRNAVSAADLARLPEAPLAWTNADTGAAGQITGITEVRNGDAICRTFRTSHQRFDGVSLYAGEACTAGAGEWELTRLVEGG